MLLAAGLTASSPEEITDMSPEKIYAFLKHLPEKVSIDKIAQSVGFESSFHCRLSRFSWRRLISIC